jgi:acetyl esterase/lipase
MNGNAERNEFTAGCYMLARYGFIVGSIEYRLCSPLGLFFGGSTPRWPQLLEDVAAAIAFVDRIAIEHGGDRKGVFLIGSSAGGHLGLVATQMSYMDRQAAIKIQPRIRGCVAFCMC